MFDISTGKYDHVIIEIIFPPMVGDATVCQYISQMYLSIWDMCVEYGSTHTASVVIPIAATGDILSSVALRKFKSREELWVDLKTCNISSGTRADAVANPCSVCHYVYSSSSIPAVPSDDNSSTRNEAQMQTRTVLFDRAASDVVKFRDDMVYFDEDLSGSGSELSRCTLPKYRRVAMGGTFDRMHSGHKILISLALAICTSELTIGITSETLLAKKSNAGDIASNEVRRQNVLDFLDTVLSRDRYSTDEATEDTIVDTKETDSGVDTVPFAVHLPTLVDPFGPTITNSNMDAIIVSSETIGGALKVNSIREEKGFAPLAIYVVRRCNAATLSSSFLRKYN